MRRHHLAADLGEGVQTYESFRVRQRAAGANMTLDVGMDDVAWVRGDSVTLQGLYTVPPHSGTVNVDVSAADATNPRVDLVIVEVKDDAHDSGGINKARVRVVAGTPTAGATLDNRNGAAALPASSFLAADVLVPAASVSVVDANIRDRRPFVAGVPALLTKVDMVPFLPPATVPVFQTSSMGSANHLLDLQQAAVLMYLPRRIVGATRVRWRYLQEPIGGSGAITGNYVLGIYDASGRKIVDTGVVAWTGTTGTQQARAETITATTFEPGWYYVMFGIDTTAGRALYAGISTSVNFGGPFTGAIIPNTVLRSATGGTTAPTTLAAFLDLNADATGGADRLWVPFVALSVG